MTLFVDLVSKTLMALHGHLRVRWQNTVSFTLLFMTMSVAEPEKVMSQFFYYKEPRKLGNS